VSDLLFIRHGRTAWNQARRIQGQTDVALCGAGRRELHGRRPPAEYRNWPWFASPLERALETARLLGALAPRTDDRLMEMNWGAWEGRTLAELRAAQGAAMAAREALGLDLRPPGGESPRDVRARLLAWLRETAPNTPRAIVVTHKGVIRAALTLATGWDMRCKPPLRLDWRRAQRFAFDAATQRLTLVEANVELCG